MRLSPGVHSLGHLGCFLVVSKLPMLCVQPHRIELGAAAPPRKPFRVFRKRFRLRKAYTGLLPHRQHAAMTRHVDCAHGGFPVPLGRRGATARPPTTGAKEQDGEPRVSIGSARHL